MGTLGSPNRFRFFGPSLSKELDPGQLGSIPATGTQLHDAGVSARTGREPRSQLLEQFARDRSVLDAPFDLAPGVQVPAPGERDELLHEWAKLFCLRFRGDHP